MNKNPVSGNTLAQNTFFNLLGQITPLLIGFFTIPILIRSLDMDRYGLLTLVWTFIGYFTFFDLGLGRAVIRSIADKLGKNQQSDIPKVFWGTLTLMTLFSLIGSAVLGLLAPTLVTDVFKIPARLEQEGLMAIYVLIIAVPIVTITAGLRGMLEADQRFGAINFLQAILGSLTFVAPLITLHFTNSIFIIVIVLVFVRFLTLIGHLVLCLRHYPGLRNFSGIDVQVLREILHFGSWLTVSNVISPVMVYFDRFILGSVVQVAQLAFYTTPYEIVNRMLVIPSAVSRVLFPAFTRSIAEDKSQVLVLLDRGLKSVALALFPVSLLIVFLAEDLLRIWIGETFATNSTPILQIFSIGILFNGIATIPFTLIQSADRPDLTAKIHLIELPLYLAAIYGLATYFGGVGAALAWTLRIVFDMFLLLFAMTRVLPQTRVRSQALAKQIIFFSAGLVLAFFLSKLESSWRWVFFSLELVFFFLYAWGYSLSLQERLYILSFLKKLPPPPSPKIENEKVCALIVCYQPEPNLIENVNVIAKQVDRVILIDNGSPAEFQWIFKAIEAKGHSVNFANDNLGIAAALNLGFFYAKKQGFDWVATFDQDSKPVNNLIAIMKETLHKHPNPHLVGLVACALRDRNSGTYLRQNKSGPWAEITTAITSGNLVRISAFEAVKGYDESLFIDYVDHDFCMKLLKAKYRIVEATEAILDHACGNAQPHRFLNIVYFSTHHNEVRRYYNTRNRFTVYRRYFLLELQWVIQDFYIFLKEVVKIILVEESKEKKIKLIALGIWHSISGKYGRIDQTGVKI